jgi:DNA-binding LacI/PurR family transcriptional regulator
MKFRLESNHDHSRITMKEIAALTGVSPITVSRAINSPHLVRPETLERIMRTIEKHQYVYDAIAGDLVRKRTKVIGIISPTIKLPMFAEISYGVQKVAQGKGYAVIVANSDYSTLQEKQLLKLFQERRVAGIIFLGILNKEEDIMRWLTPSGIPFVVTVEALDHKAISYVGTDRFKDSYSMTKYLIGLNHRRIALINGPSLEITRVRKAFEGYRAALKDHEINYDPSLAHIRNVTIIDGKEAMHNLLSLSDPPTAVFAVGSVLHTIGALAAARARGINVPEDISIAGPSDVDLATHLSPPLTSLRGSSDEMGRLSMEVLFDMIESGSKEVRQYCLDSEIIVRESCCKAKS